MNSYEFKLYTIVYLLRFWVNFFIQNNIGRFLISVKSNFLKKKALFWLNSIKLSHFVHIKENETVKAELQGRLDQ